ncbi:MAG TPA: amino acid permease C-terminal domain-containing protein, partial [Actinotalea sp.]
ILGVVACAWLMLNLPMLTWLRFLAWMVVGLGIYLAYGRRNSRLGVHGDQVAGSGRPAELPR